MAFSTIFSRRDGLDALLCNDPSFDKVLDKIDESANSNDGFDLFEEANRISGLREETADDIDDGITDVLGDDGSITDCYATTSSDIVDDYADEIHDIDIPDEIDNMEIGDMIDSLM